MESLLGEIGRGLDRVSVCVCACVCAMRLPLNVRFPGCIDVRVNVFCSGYNTPVASLRLACRQSVRLLVIQVTRHSDRRNTHAF